MSSFNRPKISFTLKDTQEFTVKDHRGFTVFVVTSQGDVKQKGKSVKI